MFQRQLAGPQQNQLGSFAWAHSQHPAEHHIATLTSSHYSFQCRFINFPNSTDGAVSLDLGLCARTRWSEDAREHSMETESVLSSISCWMLSNSCGGSSVSLCCIIYNSCLGGLWFAWISKLCHIWGSKNLSVMPLEPTLLADGRGHFLQDWFLCGWELLQWSQP